MPGVLIRNIRMQIHLNREREVQAQKMDQTVQLPAGLGDLPQATGLTPTCPGTAAFLDKFLRKTAQSMEWNAPHCQQVPPQLPEEVQRFIQGAQMCSRAADRAVFSQLPVPVNWPKLG